MPVCPIKFFPEPVLREGIQKVDFFDSKLKSIVENLLDTMKSQKHGIGIAAPQIGISYKVAIVDLSRRNPKSKKHILVNPKIIERSKEYVISREGCMSLPDYTADLKRYEWVKVEWVDENNKKHQGTFSGIEGICFQHEIDHLEGNLFLDHVACLKTDMYARHLKKMTKRKQK